MTPNLAPSLNFEKIKKTLSSERLPAVVVDLDAFDRNVRKAAEIVRQISPACTIRVATKSIRVPELISRVLAFGGPYKGLMAFSAEEAKFLADQGFDDLLVAYPTVQDSDLKLLRSLHENGKLIRLIVDNADQLKRLNEIFKDGKSPFRVVIEIDGALRLLNGAVFIGVRRSPIHDLRTLIECIQQLKQFGNLKLDGLMLYEAQVAGLGDTNPVNFWLNPAIRVVKWLSVRRIARLRKKIAEYFRVNQIPLTVFNGGGTGSLYTTPEEKWITEVTVGSGFLSSHLFDHYRKVNFEPACFFCLQIVRRAAKNWFTCAGGGYIGSGKPGLDKVPIPVFPLRSKMSPDEACGEVQTPLQMAEKVNLGDPVFFRHSKAGELAERFLEYILVSGDKISGRAKTYRGFGQCFF